MDRRAARFRLALLAALVLTLFVLAVVLGAVPSAADVRDWMDQFGTPGRVLFVPLAAGMLCLFVPGPVVAGAAGLLLGTAAGTPVALASIVLGAVLQMSISRHLAGDAAEHLLPERVKRFDRFIEERGFWAVFYMRLAPLVPYNLVNYGAGLTRLRLRAMAAGTAVGAAPRSFAWVALGGSLDDLGSTEAKAAVALIVAMTVVGALLARHRLAIERAA